MKLGQHLLPQDGELLHRLLAWAEGPQHELVGPGIDVALDDLGHRIGRAQGAVFGKGNVGRRCLEYGLIFSLRRRGSVIRFVPPFTTTEDQMDRAAQILDQAIREAVYDK